MRTYPRRLIDLVPTSGRIWVHLGYLPYQMSDSKASMAFPAVVWSKPRGRGSPSRRLCVVLVVVHVSSCAVGVIVTLLADHIEIE
jgi:hypothetical protein